MNKATTYRALLRQSFFVMILALLNASVAKAEQRRILSLSAAATHILTALGKAPVAIDQYGLIAAGEPAPPVLGRGSAISLEKVSELQINCVILWYYQNDAERLFRKRGIETVSLQPLRLNTYPELLTKLGDLSNSQAKANELRSRFESDLQAVSTWQRDKEPVRVYFELYSEWKAVGNQSFLGDLLKTAGGLCPADKSGLISPERILEFAPEVIFFVGGYADANELARRPGLASSPAVRNKRLYAVDRRLITEGLAIIEAIEFFRQQLTATR